ncbi:MAG: YIP1 family protein [Caldilineaceae bacterium]|nr:YIP1 family protein [Caldilineaceae bacterium]
MLQPQSYPEFVAKALVLDSEPFEAMVDDDNPWIEGLVFVVALSFLAGIARALGGLLTAATLPAPEATLSAAIQGWQQLASLVALPVAQGEAVLRSAWELAALSSGYTGGWSHLLPIITLPLLMLLWWVFFSLVAHGVARAMGGSGTLNATMGASALIAAPMVFLVLTIVPFASPSGAMLLIWGVLIAYRAVHIAHDLSWQNAAKTTLIVYAVALLAGTLLALMFTFGYSMGGYR